MTRNTASLAAAALSLLPLGQPLLLGTLGIATATTAVVLHQGTAIAQDAITYVKNANAKLKSKDYQGAIADYSKAIAIDPQLALAYFNRGVAKNKLKDYQGAIDDYSKAIEINPQYAKVYNNRGNSKYGLGDQQGACADYKMAVSLGYQVTAQWLNSEGGAWCRNVR